MPTTASTGACWTRSARLTGSGVAVRLMHGNRDFVFSEAIARGGGLELLADPNLRDLFGTRTLLMHGDLLCTDDVRYQRYRARVRRPGVIRAFLALPRAVRHAIGGAHERRERKGEAGKAAGHHGRQRRRGRAGARAATGTRG